MIQFRDIDVRTFLTDYWQKKPFVFRQAIPNFVNPLSADELAGLALEEEFESRLVMETPEQAPYWQLKHGPFHPADFTTLPKTHWTLLVQGVDRLIPGVAHLLEHFNFIPSWRLDDVMISYAVNQGSVGPHYDNYDVFLYQGLGRRQWSLTSQGCHPDNVLPHLDLRIMANFLVEETIILEPGDMLYLPPHIGHHGVSLSDDCMTYSFGYRSYQGQEMWNSLTDYLSEEVRSLGLYQDPNWTSSHGTAEIPPEAWQQAKQLFQSVLDDDPLFKTWFAGFVTTLDTQAEQLLPSPLSTSSQSNLALFIKKLGKSQGLYREAICRFAYLQDGDQLFINGCLWETEGVSPELIRIIANHRVITSQQLLPFLQNTADQHFLYDLWKLQWLTPSQ